ncbi:MAG: DUF6130 family protein [Thermoleophilia bacterium]
MRRATRTGIAIAAVAASAVGVAACGGGGDASGSHPATTDAANAAGPALTVEGPAAGAPVTGVSVPLTVAASGYTLNCGLAGRPVQAGVGHYHIALDKRLVNAYCDSNPSVSLQNVAPGPHTLTVVPAGNDHSEVTGAAKEVTFDYQPATPLPEVAPQPSLGRASVEIVSPRPGATVSKSFVIKVRVKNFRLSGDLFGKLPVAGYGHWHLHLDKPEMSTMMAMTSATSMPVSLEGVAPGKHTFIVMLADNVHAPIAPMVMTQVTLNVK